MKQVSKCESLRLSMQGYIIVLVASSQRCLSMAQSSKYVHVLVKHKIIKVKFMGLD